MGIRQIFFLSLNFEIWDQTEILNLKSGLFWNFEKKWDTNALLETWRKKKGSSKWRLNMWRSLLSLALSSFLSLSPFCLIGKQPSGH